MMIVAGLRMENIINFIMVTFFTPAWADNPRESRHWGYIGGNMCEVFLRKEGGRAGGLARE
jgi:hypothetical protein